MIPFRRKRKPLRGEQVNIAEGEPCTICAAGPLVFLGDSEFPAHIHVRRP